jgi:hypothetical protein
LDKITNSLENISKKKKWVQMCTLKNWILSIRKMWQENKSNMIPKKIQSWVVS